MYNKKLLERNNSQIIQNKDAKIEIMAEYKTQKTVIEIKKPNILLVEIDCLASEAIYGGNSYKPTIDRLVKDSINFKNTIVPATSTIPSFSSLFTGEFPPTHGVRSQSGFKLKSSSPNLIETLKKGGYTTYAEVTGPLMKELGFDKGFDHYYYRDKDDGLDSDWFNKFKGKLENDRLEEPWFLMLHLWEVHGPRTFPKKFDNPKYGKNAYEKALSYVDSKLKDILDSIDMEDAIVAITGDHGELYGKTRLEEIVLHTAKEIYKFKRDSGMRTDNLMPGDHGFHVYDFLIKTPLILHIDGFEGRIIEEQCRSIDILPTLLDCAGLTVDENIDGTSILPMIRDDEKMDLIAYSESTGGIIGESFSNKFCSIRTNQYKYINSPYSEDKDEKLFDIRNKPEIRDMEASPMNRCLLYLFPNLIIDRKENIIEEKPDIAKKMRKEFNQIFYEKEKKRIESVISKKIPGI